ncbi:MAG TPA: MBL fold metallo-hydrolase [Tepidisphaeraceae bacterium]|jgi:glyoxylase-like metal-dependent hydrolase (beta-lactamase superfamily II)
MTHYSKRFFACLLIGSAMFLGTNHAGAQPPPPPLIQIGEPSPRSHVPPPLRRGTFLAPQCVSALDLSDGGQFVAVGTMAFRHDRNFFLLSADTGKVLWGRHVEPWAPDQVAALSVPGVGQVQAFAAAMAFSRQTEPFPVVALFRDEQAKESAAIDDVNWDRGVLRYGGGGEWATGWTASILGDLFARGHGELFTVPSHDGNAWRWTPKPAADGKPQRFALPHPRAFRMVASADGRVLALGHLVPDPAKLDETTRQRLQPMPRGVVTAVDAAGAEVLWSAAPLADVPPPPRPPEPADDFPDLAEPFNMKPQAMVPLRLAAALSANADGSRVGFTEYGGWLRVRRQRLIGYWSGHGQGICFCPRQQRGWLRVLAADGKPLAQVELPQEGLFDLRLSSTGDTAWCVPASWFARGAAGCAWLPADGREANTVFVYDVARQAWSAAWRFPDAVADFALHPNGAGALVSCWDGRTYLLDRDGAVRAQVNLGGPARLRWSADGAFAVAGTQAGDVFCLDRQGKLRWRTTLPIATVPQSDKPLKPVFDEVPVYSVGRVGPEHAYVGDTWLIKTDQGGILVDTGGTSGIPLTLEKVRAAGLDPGDIRYLLLTHSHGDHANAAYLWRARGAEVVAPASAAFATAWGITQWTGYGVSVPIPIDRPLPLRRPGDQARITLCGVPIKAVFVPGHSIDSVVYFMELAGHPVIFTGDIAFDDRRPGLPLGSNILHRCWADRDKAAAVIRVLEGKVLPLRAEFEFKGHASNRDPAAAWRNILEASRKALNADQGPKAPAVR